MPRFLDSFWIVGGQLMTPRGVLGGAVRVAQGRIAAIRRAAPRGVQALNARGAYVAPGFIDLHVWGEPEAVSQSAVRGGTTAFLTALGPEPAARLVRHIAERSRAARLPGAECLGVHLEGPFLNPARAGALPRRRMRRPTVRELAFLAQAAGRRLKLITVAPELRGALDAIRWCRRRGIAVSLGHSDADADIARRAADAGARAVTHMFNGMRPFHHRRPGLLDVALIDERLTTMVIADGVHVSPSAFRLLVRAKGVNRIALVTDSIALQGWDVVKRRGAYYTKQGTLAGSGLTMIEAVRNAVRFGGVAIHESVRMATEVPARLLGLGRMRGTLAVGARADLVAFDQAFRVRLTIVGGQVVYQRGR